MEKTTPTVSYVLVQHSGWTAGGNPQFEQAVENRKVTAAFARKAEIAGADVYSSYGDAVMAEEEENYPPGVQGLIPQVRGTFHRTLSASGALYLHHRVSVSDPLKTLRTRVTVTDEEGLVLDSWTVKVPTGGEVPGARIASRAVKNLAGDLSAGTSEFIDTEEEDTSDDPLNVSKTS